MFKNPTIDFNTLFNSLGNSTCSSPEVVLAFLLYEGSTIHNASYQFVSCVYFFFVDFALHPPHRQKSDLYAPTSNSCIFTPIKNWIHVYMNLFPRNSPYYHLLKYLLFLLKHPVYIFDHISLKYSHNENVSDKSCIENQDTYLRYITGNCELLFSILVGLLYK